MAAEILDVGKNRVWMDPNAIDEIAMAVTKNDIRNLIKDKKIWKKPKKTPSRGRAREVQKKKQKGRKKGHGSKKGTKKARSGNQWVEKIRSLRELLKNLRDEGVVTPKTYQNLRGQAKAGRFDGKRDLKRYIKSHELNQKPLPMEK